jgi:hypothetical protein
MTGRHCSELHGCAAPKGDAGMMISVRKLMLTLPILCVASQGQLKFNNQIEPGVTRAADVEKALGKPLRTISPGQFEYPPPPGAAKLIVQFRRNDTIVEKIVAQFQKPYPPADILQALNVRQIPEKSDTVEGRLVEYYGATALISLTYAAGQASSGVSQIMYMSPIWYALAVRVPSRQAPGPSAH